jgi:tetratricopeptide (TPR) repeat protein
MIALYFENIKDITNNSDFVSNNVLTEDFNFSSIGNYKNVNSILKIKSEEKISILNYDSNKSNLITVTSKGWDIREERILNKNKNQSLEIQDINIISKINPPFLSSNHESLKNSFTDKNYIKFIEDCEIIIQSRQCSVEDYLMICYYAANVYYYKLNNFYKSKDLLLRAVSIKDTFHEAWCAWADILLDTNQPYKALDSYKKTIEKFKSRDYKNDYMPTNKTRGYEYPLEKISVIKDYNKNQIVLEKLT